MFWVSTTIIKTYISDDSDYDNLGHFWGFGREFHSIMETSQNTSFDTIYSPNWFQNSGFTLERMVVKRQGFLETPLKHGF